MIKVFWKHTVCVVSCQGCLAFCPFNAATSSSSSIRKKSVSFGLIIMFCFPIWYVQKCQPRATLLLFVNVLSCECTVFLKGSCVILHKQRSKSTDLLRSIWYISKQNILILCFGPLPLGFQFPPLSNYNFVIRWWFYGNWRPRRYSYEIH